MSKQSKIGLIVVLAVFFAFPVDAMAGGIGIFKHCRSKQQTCCPPPACAPPTCAPTTTTACVPCEVEPKDPVKDQCWQAIASGMNANQEYDDFSGDCVEGDTTDAIDNLFNQEGIENFTIYSITMHECPCTKVTPKTKPGEQNAERVTRGPKKGQWVGRAVLDGQTIKLPSSSRNLKALARYLANRYNPKMITLVREDLR